uniref:Uncharacterized protein n=1 Tax=Ditylenchus dipsaci TaxID=166011 RepID=A0A915CM42_9BILA
MSPLSSSSSPNFFAQQNGGAAGSSAQNRGQFRRQGSSYGAGHVHNMAVAVAPTRIDYSLNTKGGLRSWVVLIVFVLLCSAVLTIFSDDADSKEEEVQPLVDLSESDNDLEAEEALAESESAPTIEDEEEIVEPTPNTEEVLLAKLKEKALKNEVRRKTEKQKRTSKPMKVEVVEEEEDEEDDDEEEDEKVDSDEEDQREEEEEKKRQYKSQTQNSNHSASRTMHKKRKDTPNKKRFKPWEDSIQAKKLSEDHRTPRKSLLKQKKQQHHPHTPITHQPVILQQEQQEETLENTISEKFVEEAHALSSIKKKSGYTRKSLTNREDFKFRDDFDSADFLLEKHEFSKAMKIYDRILSRYKESPRAHFGRGRVFQLKSEFASLPSTQKEYLDQANMEYSTVIENEDTPDQLFRLAAESLIVCSKFTGNLYRVHKIQRSLIDRFPEDLDLQNDFE